MIRYSLTAMALLAASTLFSGFAASADPVLNAQAGKRLFIRCVACHSMRASARPMTSPHFEGIVSRQVAALPDFTYTDDLRGQDFVWDEARLDACLK